MMLLGSLLDEVSRAQRWPVRQCCQIVPVLETYAALFPTPALC